MPTGDVARVVQGLITGVGFMGDGTILKLTREHEIRSLTTAAGIWLTAAASIAAGLGELAAAFEMAVRRAVQRRRMKPLKRVA